MLLGLTVFLRPSLPPPHIMCLGGYLGTSATEPWSPAESPRWQRHARRIDSLHHEACPRSYASRRFDRPYMAQSVFDHHINCTDSRICRPCRSSIP